MALQKVHAASTVTDGQITICHSTQPNPSNGGGQGPQGNPYTKNTVSVEAVNGGSHDDHSSHVGDTPTHVYRPGDTSWGDIIPAYPAGSYIKGNKTYDYPAYDGLNWNAEGQAIYDNGCEMPLPKDATASVTVVPPTCVTAGTATYAVAYATLNGPLNLTVGSHTATFAATSGHLFADGKSNLTVPYEILPKLTGPQCAGPKPDDERKTRLQTGTPVCLPNGTGTVSSWTEEQTRAYVYDAVSGKWIPGEWSDWSPVANSTTTRPATKQECPISPTAPTPNDSCGRLFDTYTIPNTQNVSYRVKIAQIGQTEIYAPVSAGSHDTLGVSSVKIKAFPANGYVLSGQNVWTLQFNTADCPVSAAAPTSVDECGTNNDSFTIPNTDHITYKKLVGYLWNIPLPIFAIYDTIGAGTYDASGTVHIKAFAAIGYDIDGTNKWIFEFDDAPCDTPVVPNTPTKIDECGTREDGYTISPTLGVKYYVGNQEVGVGFHPASGSVTITAQAEPTYVLSGAASWTYEFSEDSCEPEPCVPSVVSALALDRLATDEDCPPGMGGGGQEPEVPSNPKTPVVPVSTEGIELPETGANQYAQLFSIIGAGILTYGAMFYLVNRRNLRSNK